MTYPRPTLTELRQQTQTDIKAALPGAEVLLRYSNLGIMGGVMAGLANGQYGYLDYIALNATPFTAIDEALEAWAALKGVFRKVATKAGGTLHFTGAADAPLPSGSSVIRNDGYAYVTTVDATLGADGADVPIRAVTPGAAGNADSGTAFMLTLGVSGVNAAAVSSGPITGGADLENHDDLRSRMLDAFANPPQGGSVSDYRQWARSVPGVTRAWVTPNGMGPSTVVIYFMMDDAQAAHGGFPQGTNGVAAAETRDTVATGDQLALANAVFLKQPATPTIYAVAPQPNVLDFIIAGLANASPSLKSAISTAIDTALLVNGIPGGSTDVSAIEAAIAAVNGSAGFVLISISASAGTVSPGSAGNVVSNAGKLPVRGSITWL